jgi:cell division protein FtsW
MMSRAEPTPLGRWWWTIDRTLLGSILGLMVIGVVLLMAGGPPVAERLGLSTFYFVHRQALFLVPALALMVAVSFLPPRWIRRLALVLFIGALAGVVLTLFVGPEVKGARRWLPILGQTIQPSEFLKPAFVVIVAWAFSEGARRSDVPGTALALILLPITVTPLILQPDFGQTMLLTLVWSALFFIAGLHWFWVMALAVIGFVGIILAYEMVPHVRERIERFMDKDSGDRFNIDTALESFSAGGFLGKGPGEGSLKRVLPEAHTDFIFAVTGEEFGVVVCLVLVAIFATIVIRSLWIAQASDDPFRRFAVAGLAMLFGVQASINMLVNVDLMPAKGMTLPFISYGGSSLISLALTTGFLIALTRKRPRAEELEMFERHPAAPARA